VGLLGNLGRFRASVGDAQGAIEAYQAGAVGARLIGELISEGVCLGNMGLTYALIGNPAAARHSFERALDLHVRVGFPYGQPYWMGGLAELEPDLDVALRQAQNALTAARPFPLVQASVTFTLIKLHLKRGEIEAARQGVETLRESNLPASMQSGTAALDALVYMAAGDRRSAEACLEESAAAIGSMGILVQDVVRRVREGLAALSSDSQQ
jgi:tetratricopeptide (TPR) repeat protein